MSFLLKPYAVAVYGYNEVQYEAASPAKARAKAWRDFTSAHDCSFHDFLIRSTVRRIPDPPRFGEKVLVSGEVAYLCLPSHNQYTRFAREDSEGVFYSHPADVRPIGEVVPA
ncbi:hypothetical protein [Mesorhizobium opportunistum]|uniref:Uncharacterized protein n=1 Tax=Mesorhizobium opportunistum (strain LMG 24607 / HAMBI 3007 / WSM2075) TaxID=536019 RepID=F7XZV9_MESOW|nr:hypothetical protein [Mesorhizobium opportunistum]AEH88173.1 hypothetical protein Mesop_3731 [Mesorhizobium opportunistum WSM2075]